MHILYSPQLSMDGDKIEYTLERDIVKVNYKGNNEKFDFTDMSDGMATVIESDVFEFCPVVSAERKDGVLYLTLLNFIDFDSSEEERYPEWLEVFFDGKDQMEDN